MKLVHGISIDESEWDKPLEHYTNTGLDVCDPYSAVACWVLYQYSMELGSPPLDMELNSTCREMDQTLLPQLGPFARALA